MRTYPAWASSFSLLVYIHPRIRPGVCPGLRDGKRPQSSLGSERKRSRSSVSFFKNRGTPFTAHVALNPSRHQSILSSCPSSRAFDLPLLAAYVLFLRAVRSASLCPSSPSPSYTRSPHGTVTSVLPDTPSTLSSLSLSVSLALFMHGSPSTPPALF